MIKKKTFLLQHKKNASSHLFSKQLKNLQSNQLIVGFISIIYSSFASSLRAEGPKAPEAARPEGPKAQKQHALFCPTRPERAEAPSPGHRPG